MLAVYKLQAKAYFSNIWARIDFITAFLFLVVVGTVTKINGVRTPEANVAVIASISILMVLNSAMWSFGFSFFEMKDSVLLKRIGATKISKPKAVLSFLMWGFTTTLLVLSWLGLWIGICQIPAVAKATDNLLYIDRATWLKVNWLGVFLAIIISSVSFYSIAFLFVSFNKNSEIYNITGTFYFFIIAFLGGAVAPTAGREWMTVIGYLSPLGWMSKFMGDAMLGAPIFHFGGYASISQNEQIGSLLAIGRIAFPIIFGALAAGASIKLFKWD